MQDKPSQAVRRGRGSSMWLALEAVQKGEAEVAVSAGNTGALMAMAKLILRTMPGIERPVIAGQWPTVGHNSIVLDLGANIGATARQLADFALMGAPWHARCSASNGRVSGLLNIGVEEIKGIEEVRQAHAWLKENDLPIDYRGFVEGDQIGQGIVDVVVVEGYAGNIALKTAEGTARQMAAYVREALDQFAGGQNRSTAGERGLRALKDRMDPRRLNGGPFLGLNGIVIEITGAPTLSASPARLGSATTWPKVICWRASQLTWSCCTASSVKAGRRKRNRHEPNALVAACQDEVRRGDH